MCDIPCTKVMTFYSSLSRELTDQLDNMNMLHAQSDNKNNANVKFE
jgi:hypothetical protein